MTSKEVLDKYILLVSQQIKRDVELQFLDTKSGKYIEASDFVYIKFQETSGLGRYRLITTPTTKVIDNLASWQLEEFPHCCGIAVSCGSYIYPKYRGKGLGVILNNFRQDICRVLGFGCLVCTDVADNLPQRKILQKNGWMDLHKFRNPRTNHQVIISAINL